MSRMNNNTARGVITFHTPFPVSMLKSEERGADVKEATGRRGSPSPPGSKRSPGGRERGEAPSCGPQPGAKQERLNHASLRRLKAKMEAESQKAKEITQPLLDTEKGLVKDLERFLSHRHGTEMRRRELLHKRWTERVWLPLQRRVEERASGRGPPATGGRQSSHSHYLHDRNAKGFVFLDRCDLREYNPFLVHVKEQHFFELSAVALKAPLYLQSHERVKKKGTPGPCKAGCKYTRKPVEKRPQSDPPLCGSVTSGTDKLLQASLNHPITETRNTARD